MMKQFHQSLQREAIAYAGHGGQALHLFHYFPTGPICFRRAAAAGKPFAHLFDQNTVRLEYTARKLGVRKIFVHHAGTPHQHIDLCARPLDRAVRQCLEEEQNEWEKTHKIFDESEGGAA